MLVRRLVESEAAPCKGRELSVNAVCEVQQSVTQYVLIVSLIDLDLALVDMPINEATPLDKRLLYRKF